ncbi:uncharacterized protein [Linepithema humile]|uniref:uncharacterized protein n=1 Tax=Linepithema humile TaxID=83485 RepID=UPI00351DEE39
MFILQCESDGSYCVVHENAVIFDEENIRPGDKVMFVWNKKHYDGSVIMRSDDETKIDEKIKMLKAEEKNKRASKSKCNKSEASKVIDRSELGSSRKKASVKRWSPETKLLSGENKKPRNVLLKGNGAKSNKSANWQEKLSSAMQAQVSKVIDIQKKEKSISIENSNLSSSPDSKNASWSEDESNRELTTPEKIAKKKHYAQQKQSDIAALMKIASNAPVLEPRKKSELPALKKNETKELSRNYYSIVDDENKDLRQDLESKIKNIKAKETTNKIMDDDEYSDDDYPSTTVDERNLQSNDQLLGQNSPGDKMVLLQDGVFCNERVLEVALSSSHKASHIVRRLIVGVFKLESLKDCTFTGASHRGVHENKDDITCLNLHARNSIIDYAMKLAKRKGWVTQSIKELNTAMSQKLGEIKRELKNADAQNK